jgi:hypothetical protein
MPGLTGIGRGAANAAPLVSLFGQLLGLFPLACFGGCDEAGLYSLAASTILAIEFHANTDCVMVRWRGPSSSWGHSAPQSGGP